MASGNPGDNIAVSHQEARVLRGVPNDAEFDRRFQQAWDLTKDVSISKMNRNDINVLNKMMHERPQLLQTSRRYHYLKFAHLCGIPTLEARMMENAEGVLEYLMATKEVEPTVAEILTKLRDTQECYNIVRELVDNIIQREQHDL